MIRHLFQNVVVAYNGSVSSLHAVMYAILMAKSFKSKVKVISVIDTASIKQLILSKFLVKDEGEGIQSSLEADSKKNLDYIENLAKSKGVKIETEVRHGAIWSEIVTAADDYKADLILLGGVLDDKKSFSMHKNSLSSQNNEIIASAHCSVMVVREPYIEQIFKHC